MNRNGIARRSFPARTGLACCNVAAFLYNRYMDERYDRNLRISGFGERGQRALLGARVLVVGAGGLGSPAILYLAAAGVGTLAVADGDAVSLSNLQRQILYGTADIGKNKAEAACAAITRLNPDVSAAAIPERLDTRRMEALFPAYDCILDCTDRAAVKYAINDACVALRKPYIHAGVLGMAGQLMTYAPGHACLRCAFPVPDPAPPDADVLGILGAAAGALGSLQAAEAVKLITGVGAPLYDALLHVDIAAGEFVRVRIERNPACSCCGGR